MDTSIYIPAAAEPISLAEMKNHLKQDSDITTDDALISAQIMACRDVIETRTGANVDRQKVMLATTFETKLDYFPPCIYLPRVPLVSISSIKYIDTDGVEQTFSSSKYTIVNAQLGIVELAYGETWPMTRSQTNAVTVRYVAGIAAPFTAATTGTCTVTGREFTTGDRVKVINSGGDLPTGLSALTTYYVINASGSTFKLSLTSGGPAVSISAIGTGTHYIAADTAGFETLRAAIKLLVGQLYSERGDGGRQASAQAVSNAIDALVNSQHA